MQVPAKQISSRLGPHVISLALHGLVLGLLCWRPTPQFIQPSSVRLGEGGTSITPIYFARKGGNDALPAANQGSTRSAAMHYPARQPRPKPQQRIAADRSVEEEAKGTSAAQAAQGPRAGSLYGSLAEGPATGEEVKPALPIYGPQPQVASYEIPAGLEGDIVVEITIDAQGNVTETVLLRGLGHGLDERVLAVLPTWRFHPATRDGVPIPSRQDVYFHFPRPA